MSHFLVVEDSPIVSKIIKHVCKDYPFLTLDLAASFAEARQLIESNKENYLCAVVDLNLPDAPNGEVVDYSIKEGLPTIVLTGSYDEDKRKSMLEKPIVDYVVKESRFSYEYVIKLVERLTKNRDIKVLVVDDSRTQRTMIKSMLKNHLFQVVEADDGDTALATINEDSDIKLVITDYNMPRMNGFDLVKNVRKEASKNSLVIVGLSGQGDSELSAKFIKNGANDFLTKPFSHEEFHCRILHNIENMEYIAAMEHMAYHDYISGLPNKRFLFEEGNKALETANAKQSQVSMAVISIDRLNEYHERYGFDATEAVMRDFGSLLRNAFPRFTFARLTDSDSAVLLIGLNLQQASQLIENFRVIVEDHIVLFQEYNLKLTISAGVCMEQGMSLSELIRTADNNLYQATQLGGNQINNGSD